ncbi:serine/threonine-protein phosphatase 6 regulatory ankyrin repeat subunit C-like [Cyanistes caeruleus]|uniref:serine/threonine-protein phosphatase 6 regulatory ankyrin repeat subunit C-like n=1 Tax=Cyanistes caeruleus TaxID=156563 RepID=UPI000CDA3509|nr:serine/threonine-protein phosphatase 6 regulatory ankyrin repeat subunit C-like [Cyanistes caeruleus]
MFWMVLKVFWGVLGGPWEGPGRVSRMFWVLGGSRKGPGSILECSGGSWDRVPECSGSWKSPRRVLGESWKGSGGPGRVLKGFWGVLGGSWKGSGVFWEGPGRVLGCSGRVLEGFWGQLGHCGMRVGKASRGSSSSPHPGPGQRFPPSRGAPKGGNSSLECPARWSLGLSLGAEPGPVSCQGKFPPSSFSLGSLGSFPEASPAPLPALLTPAPPCRRGIHDMFPLHLAVLFGFSDCCRKLLSSGQLYSIVSSLSNEHVLSAGFDINTPDCLGRTCLHAAASGGNVECLNLLLSSGADLRRRDKFGRTPLHYAAANGSYQCTVTLVTAGASANEADGKGCTPLHYAAASDTYRRAETHSGASDEEPLKESRLKEAFFCLEFLLDNGADPSLRDKQGYTAVHYAAAYGNRQNLELLLEMSFNCLEDVESSVPVSPLHLAAYNGHCEALKALAETLVNLDVRDHKGRTALYLATERGSSECVQVLTSHGASALLKERKRKWTPLHAAAANGNTDSLHLLIDSGERADITDVMDIHGQTPLMLAIMNGHVDCVHLLLEKGSTADAADKRGRTALHRGGN